MKLNILILLLFFTIFQSKADQIYELIKIPNLKIYKIDKESNLKYLTPKKDFVTNSGINNVSCKKSKNDRVEEKYIKTKNELDDYKKTFFKKIKLKYIVLCEKLKVGEVNALGFANPKMETILLNINVNNKNFERVIHHEVFHIIENNYKKFFPDTTWAKLIIQVFIIQVIQQIQRHSVWQNLVILMVSFQNMQNIQYQKTWLKPFPLSTLGKNMFPK